MDNARYADVSIGVWRVMYFLQSGDLFGSWVHRDEMEKEGGSDRDGWCEGGPRRRGVPC